MENTHAKTDIHNITRQTPKLNLQLIQLAYQQGYDISGKLHNNLDLAPIYSQYHELINGYFNYNLEGKLRGGPIRVLNTHANFLGSALELIDENLHLMPNHYIEQQQERVDFLPENDLVPHSSSLYTIDSDYVLENLK